MAGFGRLVGQLATTLSFLFHGVSFARNETAEGPSSGGFIADTQVVGKAPESEKRVGTGFEILE